MLTCPAASGPSWPAAGTHVTDLWVVRLGLWGSLGPIPLDFSSE